MENQLIHRLATILRRHKGRLGSWPKLAQAIEDANDRDPSRRIERRTLEKICGKSAETVQLRLGQLLALDTWISLSNEGSLLARDESLLDSVLESYSVNFLVAAKQMPDMRGEAVARYDLRAITRLLRTKLNRLKVGIWDIEGPKNWRSSDTQIVNAANISIGSPVANYASEMLMRRMLGVSTQTMTSLTQLPFFIVGAQRDEKLNSTFVHSAAEATLRNPNAGIGIDPDRRVLVVNNKWHVSSAQEDYALLLAQRDRANGQVQLVLCGLTGQGTYQLARLLQAGQPPRVMPALNAGEKNPPILTAVYKLTMKPNDSEHSRDPMKVIGVAAVGPPAFIRHVDGEWRFLE